MARRRLDNLPQFKSCVQGANSISQDFCGTDKSDNSFKFMVLKILKALLIYRESFFVVCQST
jgi:hypothetical protein